MNGKSWKAALIAAGLAVSVVLGVVFKNPANREKAKTQIKRVTEQVKQVKPKPKSRVA